MSLNGYNVFFKDFITNNAIYGKFSLWKLLVWEANINTSSHLIDIIFQISLTMLHELEYEKSNYCSQRTKPSSSMYIYFPFSMLCIAYQKSTTRIVNMQCRGQNALWFVLVWLQALEVFCTTIMMKLSHPIFVFRKRNKRSYADLICRKGYQSSFSLLGKHKIRELQVFSQAPTISTWAVFLTKYFGFIQLNIRNSARTKS